MRLENTTGEREGTVRSKPTTIFLIKGKRCKFAGLIFVLLIFRGGALFAQDGPEAPKIFIHAVIQAGYESMSSRDIEAFMFPYRLKGDWVSSGNVGLGLRVGFRNILQLEYRADYGGAPDLYISKNDDIQMKKSNPKVFLVRLNPVFWLMKNPFLGLFLVYGEGKDGRYLDQYGYGWRNGDMKIYGLEGQIIFKWISCGIGFDYRDWTYSRLTLYGMKSLSIPFQASSWQIFISLGAGFGI